jgi:hypothetical protein
MGQIALIIRMNSVSTTDLPAIRTQFQQFLQTTLPAALLAANPTTQATFTVDKNSTYAENF